MYRNKEDSISLSAVLSKIKSADDIEISKIIEAVVERYSLVCPDWEVMFYFLPSADTEERRLYAENLIDYLNKNVLKGGQ